MAQASPGSQAGGTQGAYQPMVVLFERDESLAGMLLGQLRALGYECRSARIPVEVFDLIARYPVGLVLVNLAQAAAGRRDFWVALENKQRERGVRCLTYRFLVPGAKRETENLAHPQIDVEMAGPQQILALVQKVQEVLPAPARPASAPDLRPAQSPAIPAAPAAPPAFGSSPDASARPAIAGVLNLSNGGQAGKQAEFAPLPGAANGRSYPSWLPDIPGVSSPPQSAQGQAAPLTSPGYPNNGASSPSHALENGMLGNNGHTYLDGAAPTPLLPTMPMGDLANLTAAINALVAAGAPGYQNAAAMAQALDQASASDHGEAARRRESGGMGQEVWTMQAQGMAGSNGYNGQTSQGAGMAPAPSGQGRANPAPQANGAARYGNEPLFATYPAPEGARSPQEPGRSQDARSHTLGGRQDEYEPYLREPAAQMRGGMEDASGAAWRPSGGVAPAGYSAQQNQMLAPVAVPGQVERSLGNVLVEGQLLSQQRLEIALGIQRLLRGADIDYRLGELLVMFKFLTPDQLLAALLVSRGMVTPAQVAAMGRIKQELHNIGMEYDLENLLILFRLLSSEQLREVRSEIP